MFEGFETSKGFLGGAGFVAGEGAKTKSRKSLVDLDFLVEVDLGFDLAEFDSLVGLAGLAFLADLADLAALAGLAALADLAGLADLADFATLTFFFFVVDFDVFLKYFTNFYQILT